jgi:selenium metabolism protein YedF
MMSVINVVGKPCPIPVIEAKKALRLAKPGEQVRLIVDNDIARQNLQKMASGLGCGFSYGPAAGAGEGESNIEVVITAPAEKARANRPEAAAAGGDAGGLAAEDSQGLVVTIGSDCMGRGEDELGRSLMKAFIYSLTELDVPPEYLLFFNGGVKLTTAGANTLPDLRTLADKGVSINSCGACLNYYQLTEKLAIGNITNMYAIATTMAQARRLINLN